MTDRIVKCTPDGRNFSIWCIPANFNYFVKTAVEPDTAEGVVNKTSSVKAHVRRKYIDDPAPSNVDPHSRTYLFDPGRKVGNAIPGFSFILDDEVEKRQFTLQGDVVDLHAYLVSNLSKDVTLYTEGASYEIKAPADGG